MPETGEKKPPKVLIVILSCDLDLLTLKCNQLIFVPNCTKVVNSVKFPQSVCKISC